MFIEAKHNLGTSTETKEKVDIFAPLKMGRIGCPKTSVKYYKSTMRKIPEDLSDVHGSGSVKARQDKFHFPHTFT
jgi:hypothetical protein